MGNKQNKRQNKTFGVGIILKIVLPLVFAAAVFAACLNWWRLVDFWRAWQFKPTEEMSGLIADLELTGGADMILRAADPKIEGRDSFNQSCPGSDQDVYVLGCYYDGRVVVFDVESDELNGIKQVTLAHEMLHAVYEKYLSEGEREKLAGDLERIYEGDEVLQERLSHYSEDKKYGELHSIVGSEFSEISTELEAHFAKYFKNRAEIAARYAGYSGKMKQLREESEQLSRQISEAEAEIERMKVEYESDWADLSARIEDFNYRANNGYFTSQAAFNYERSALVAESGRLDGVWQGINGKINEYNGLIERYNSIATHINQLGSEMDSNYLEKPEEV